MKLAIFPGHVGKDPGAIDHSDGPESPDKLYSVEAVITQGIASKLALLANLVGMEYKYAYGSFDYRISSTEDCTAGISIHADVSTDPATKGFHCIYFPGSAQGKGLAHAIDESISVLYPRARTVHSRRDLAILRQTAFPCVLIECGFLSNPTEEAQLMTEEHQYNLAFQILAGYREWAFE